MEECSSKDHHDGVFSRSVKAGKRTYFFDVKATSNDDLFITITESKRRFDSASGKFSYEKHKIFLYQQDFEKFANGLSDVIEFVESGQIPPLREENILEEQQVDVTFEDLTVNS